MNQIQINVDDICFEYDKFLGYKAFFVQEAEKLLHEKFLIHKLNHGLILDKYKEEVEDIRDNHDDLIENEEHYFTAIKRWRSAVSELVKANYPRKRNSRGISYLEVLDFKKKLLSENDEIRALWKEAIKEWQFQEDEDQRYLDEYITDFMTYHLLPRARDDLSKLVDDSSSTSSDNPTIDRDDFIDESDNATGNKSSSERSEASMKCTNTDNDTIDLGDTSQSTDKNQSNHQGSDDGITASIVPNDECHW